MFIRVKICVAKHIMRVHGPKSTKNGSGNTTVQHRHFDLALAQGQNAYAAQIKRGCGCSLSLKSWECLRFGKPENPYTQKPYLGISKIFGSTAVLKSALVTLVTN